MTYNVFSGTLNPTHFTSRVQQRAPPIFDRAAVTLGIGPHFQLWTVLVKLLFCC